MDGLTKLTTPNMCAMCVCGVAQVGGGGFLPVHFDIVATLIFDLWRQKIVLYYGKRRHNFLMDSLKSFGMLFQ